MTKSSKKYIIHKTTTGSIMVENIDHILIHASNVMATLQEIEDTFELKASVSLAHYGYFSSAIVRFGNTDIEIVELGDKKDFKPYLYGLALASSKTCWDLLADLNKENIAHTLPLTIKSKYSTLSWTSVTLKEGLDNPMATAYGLYTQNFFTQSMSKFFGWLMSKDSIAKAMTKNVGESALFFVEFHNDIEALRKECTEDFLVTQNGGKYNLLNVESIAIEKTKGNTLWEKLGQPSDTHSPKLTFTESKKNKLKHIVLNAKETHRDREIMIGDVRFIIR